MLSGLLISWLDVKLQDLEEENPLRLSCEQPWQKLLFSFDHNIDWATVHENIGKHIMVFASMHLESRAERLQRRILS